MELVCPKFRGLNAAPRLSGICTKQGTKNTDGTVRHGLGRRRGFRSQFTVSRGTIFEGTHVLLDKGLQAIDLMASGVKHVSSDQLG